MQKMIAADRLARPDNFVLVRSRRMREIREEQGLDDRVLPFDEEALRVRLHGIFVGELQAMERAGRGHPRARAHRNDHRPPPPGLVPVGRVQ